MLVAFAFCLTLFGVESVNISTGVCGVKNCRRCHEPATGPPPLQRAGGKSTDGESTKPDEHPWLALVYYPGSDRKCAASLISDRHMLTARLCVDAEGPHGRSDKLVSVDSVRARLTLGGYLGEKEVIKIITWLDDKYDDGQYADLAVLEFKPALYEWDETLRPICLANEYSFSHRGDSFTVVHWGELGPKNRETYTFSPTLENYQQCQERIVNGLSHNKLHTHDESFCLVREAKMLQSGVYQGAPVLKMGDTASPNRNRLQQVGIVTHIDEGNNVALATSLPHYADAIQKMTECYVQAKGFDSFLAPDRPCKQG